MIQVYSPDNADFEKNGDMTLLPTSCELACEINGTWELTMSHPLDAEERWKYIEQEAVIACPTFQGNKQLFRVDKCVKTESSVEITAYPIFFDSADDSFLMDVRPTQKNGQEALDIMTSGSKYSGQSDIMTTGTAYFVRRNLMDAINGEDSPTFVQAWGGEILFDNYTVIINQRIGGDYGADIRYGKNMNGLSYTVDMSDVATRIVPVAYNGRMMSGNTPWVDSENINKYVKKYIREVKFEDVKLSEDVDSSTASESDIICQTQTELNAALTQKCEAMYAAGADLPAVTIKVSMVDLEHTEQYKDFTDLVKIALGDTVHCHNTKLGITTDARVIGLKWDCIRNESVEMTLGDYEYNYFEELTSNMQAVNQIIGPGNTVIAERVSGVLNAIQTQLRYQKNVAQKQDVRAILFEDTDPDSPTYGAMCLGTQGFQISDKRTVDGNDWDWSTAFTAKGGYADVLIAGILSDRTGKSFWNLDTGELQLSGVFRQFATNGFKSVDIDNNQVRVYSWRSNGDYVGSIGSILRNSDGRMGMEMWCDTGDLLILGYDNGLGDTENLIPILSFDSQTPEKPPYIINTASGKIFPDNSDGGIEVENGLIKSWNLKYSNGTIFGNNPGGGITVKDGIIEEWHLDTSSGTISVISGLSWTSEGITSVTYTDIEVGGGLIISWSRRTVDV